MEHTALDNSVSAHRTTEWMAMELGAPRSTTAMKRAKALVTLTSLTICVLLITSILLAQMDGSTILIMRNARGTPPHQVLVD